MRRKGKPKAKTKLASNNCDSDQQKQMATPLISISHAPSGSSNPNSPASCNTNDTNAYNQPAEVVPTTGQQQKQRETVVLFDGQSETTRETVLESRGEQVARIKKHCCKLLQRLEMSVGIELVRQSYIKLMARNSLYQFHLGSFAFSVMNMIFLLTFNCCTLRSPGAVNTLTPMELNDTIMRPINNNNNNSNNNNNNNNNQTGLSSNCDNDPANWRTQSVQDLRGLVWLLLISLMLVTAVQLTVIILECYTQLRQHRRGEQPAQRPLAASLHNISSSNCQDNQSDPGQPVSTRLMMSLAIIASYLLLILPTFVFHINQSTWICPGKSPSLPLTTLAITIYLITNMSLWPAILNSSSRLLRCSYFLLLLLILTPIMQKINGQYSLLACFIMLFAITLSIMRNNLYISTHHDDTFKQASQLIEAKVSLEQQRQQQETLLLSVLPAYVAEQVKRNMLKKMETVKEPAVGVDLLDGNCDSMQTSQLNSNASGGGNFSASPLQSLRSLTLPANCDGPPAAPRDQRDHQATGSGLSIPKRRSFASRLKLNSSFASSPNRSRTGRLVKNVPTTLATSDQSSHHQTATDLAPLVAPSGTNLNAIQFNSAHQVHQSHQSRRGFNELYIRTYNNVSLLYGDIVGFTRLCSQLSSSQLVLVLNNLFSYFDYLAEQHKIMRIKILGDCYYGVSGIPEFAVLGAKSSSNSRHHYNGPSQQVSQTISTASLSGKSGDNHAINCVNMGLDMIQYIKCLNIERTSQGHDQLAAAAANVGELSGQTELPANFELNMRIGIHTGHIHSGVIGLKKWQFDVWSNDVSIAMHCESSGVAGRVQVTEATVQHLRNAFTIEQATRSSRDTFLADRSIRTFLIVDRVQLPVRPSNNHLIWKNDQQTTPAANKSETSELEQQPKRAPAYSFAPSEIQAMDQGRIREATIGTIRQTLLAGELGASGGGSSGFGAGCGAGGGTGSGSPLTSSGLARLDHNDMRWWTLEFKEPALNGLFNSRLISASHQLGQLCLLFLVLIVFMQTLNYKLIDWTSDDNSNNNNQNQNQNHLLMIASFLLTLPLIAVAFLPKRRSIAETILRRRRSTLTDGASIRSSPTHWIRANNMTPDIVENQMSSNELVQKRHNKWVKCFKLMRLNKLFSKLKPSKWRFGKREANNLLGAHLVALTLILFVLFQYNILRRDACNQLLQNQMNNRTEASHRLKQLHQLTIFSLLAALDLSSALLPFRLRAAFLVVIALIQFLILCATANTLRRREGNSLFQQLLTASRLVGALCGSMRQNDVNVSTTNNSKTTLTTIDIGQHLLDWSSDALLLVLSLWSWAFQRQLEYSQRANFLWRNRLNVDHEELEYISGINKVLLENILPSHVVQHYLDQPMARNHNNERPIVRENVATTVGSEQKRDRKASRVLVASGNQLMGVGMSPSQLASLPEFPPTARGRPLAANGQTLGHELYHEQHESVAVMFASIPHFYEFYDESDISKQGLGCIALLNEIICDFDKLLLKNKFSRIEKIKTIGSTYMAAAGLRPSCPASVNSARSSNASQLSQQPLLGRDSYWQQVASGPNCLNSSDQQQQQQQQQQQLASAPDRRLVLSQQKMNLICMIQFATSLMSALNGINKQSFQLFKLRVGVNTGPVVAGIIGAQRPFYDIWGDCVNIASRMESLGEVGRIQVEERTAKLLSECLCPETYAIEKRGPIDVKGKGGMVTYFVDKRQQSQSPQPPQPMQQQQQQQQQQQRHELAD